MASTERRPPSQADYDAWEEAVRGVVAVQVRDMLCAHCRWLERKMPPPLARLFQRLGDQYDAGRDPSPR